MEAHIFSCGLRFGLMAMGSRSPSWAARRHKRNLPFHARARDRRSGLSCNSGVTEFQRSGKTWIRTRAAVWRRGGGPAPRLGISCSRAVLASPAWSALPGRNGASFRRGIRHLAMGRRTAGTRHARPGQSSQRRIMHCRCGRIPGPAQPANPWPGRLSPVQPSGGSQAKAGKPASGRERKVCPISRRRMARGFWRRFSLLWRSGSTDSAAKANRPAKPGWMSR